MVQLSYIKELLDTDLDCQRALTGELVIIEITEVDFQLPIFTYVIELLLPGKTVLSVLAKFSYFSVAKQMTQDGADLRNIYFIDCVSQKKHLESQASSHVVELEKSTQLKTVFGTLLDQTDEFAKDSVTCFDDITALRDISPDGHFLRFFHLLLTKLRNKNVGGVLVLPKDVFSKEEYDEIKQLVDRVIHL